MEMKRENWRQELTDFVQDDIDGRFWLDDMVQKVIDGVIPSQAFDDYVKEHENDVDEVSFAAGESHGYSKGYDAALLRY